MINLINITYENGHYCPVSLQIKDKMYYYGEDTLFDKLENYKNETIIVNTIGFKKTQKTYIIEDIIIDEIPKLKLGEINESLI